MSQPGPDRSIVSVDTYPDVPVERHGREHQPSVGSSFSLLPAQNTSGNWVKVVQRIPMRVASTHGRQAAAARGHERQLSVSIPAMPRGLPDFADRPVRLCGRRGSCLWPAQSRRRRARCRQPRRDHRLRDPCGDHAGARHDDRQCGAALHPGQRLGERRSDQLGPDLLHRRRGDHDAAVRLPRRPLRPQDMSC